MLKTSSTSDILHTQGAPYLLHFHLFGLSSCEATGKYTTILYVLINSKKILETEQTLLDRSSNYSCVIIKICYLSPINTKYDSKLSTQTGILQIPIFTATTRTENRKINLPKHFRKSDLVCTS
jgi:hypothetical protein